MLLSFRRVACVPVVPIAGLAGGPASPGWVQAPAPSPPTMTMWPCTRITSMRVPYRALRLCVVSTVPGDPAAQRPAAT